MPNYAKALENKGVVLEKLGKEDEVEGHYKKARQFGIQYIDGLRERVEKTGDIVIVTDFD